MGLKPVNIKEGMEIIEMGVTKVTRILEGLPESPIDSDFYMQQYTNIYNICKQSVPIDFCDKVYHKYKLAFMDYLQNTVLPALRQSHDLYTLLKELVKRWSNHKLMTKWLSRFFTDLNYHINRYSLPSLHEVAIRCFRDTVYQEVHDKVTDAILTLIRLERDGGQIDQALLKNALEIYMELGTEQYVNNFETLMLNDTTAYYSQKSASWIQEYSYSEYMLKVEECLKKEKDRVAHYLHADTEYKLLERVQHELLMVYENQLLGKESSGLLKDEKVGDLSRMYRQLETFSVSHPRRSLVMKNRIEDLRSRECIV